MCLAGLALGASDALPLVVVSNRDEFFERPTAPMAWWPAPAGGATDPGVLAGRDLRGGGTWLGLNRAGRLALLTNIRAPSEMRSDAPSRGALVSGWLEELDAAADAARYHQHHAGRGYNGYNLLLLDLARGRADALSSRQAAPRPLSPGLHVVSNGALDEPWPKVKRLRAGLQDALAAVDPHADVLAQIEPLAERLFTLLAERTIAPDAELPATGVPLALERALSALFIRTADGRYGTRCSTVLISARARDGRRLTRVIERSVDADSRPAGERRFDLPDWPAMPIGAP